MKIEKIILLGILLSSNYAAAFDIRYSDVVAKDGTSFQICTRYPDSAKFSGKRPALMITPGSGRYDSCQVLEKSYSDNLSENGIVLFARQKRGLRRNVKTKAFETNFDVYKNADLPHLKKDTLQAFENLLKDPRIDTSKVALFGGSEGTILATYIARHHPEVKEVSLISSMIEEFPSLFKRQFYILLPKELVKLFDKNSDEALDATELSNEQLLKFGFGSFSTIDSNNDRRLVADEISAEIKRVVAYSLENDDSTFFLSEIGGGIPVSWMHSAKNLKSLSPQVLKLHMPVYIHHGTLDYSTEVGPVRELEKRAKVKSKKNLEFTYYEGLNHTLTPEVIREIYAQIGSRLASP